jgi:peptidoglycan/xylan/chitin deacetylase (PgdA/CDA1 family)
VLRAIARAVAVRLAPRGRPIILMYHRVARVACDPWELAVWPERFAEQVDVLVQRRTVVPLRWLCDRLSRGQAPRDTAAVTFDDGYADVLTHAKPVLERHGCPATVFLTTGAIGGEGEFWWDELSRLVLASCAPPAELHLEVAGRPYAADELAALGRDAAAQLHRPAPRCSRASVHLALWLVLRPLDPVARRHALDALAAWAGDGCVPGTARTLTVDEARRLAAPGFVDVGAHSVTHRSMPSLDPEDKRREARESKEWCQALTGAPIDAFAYPHGELDDDCVAAVREAGFAFACGVEHAALAPGTDPMRLPRYGIGNWEAEEFARWLDR